MKFISATHTKMPSFFSYVLGSASIGNMESERQFQSGAQKISKCFNLEILGSHNNEHERIL